MFRSLLNVAILTRLFSNRNNQCRAVRPGYRPVVERLEQREVLSISPVSANAGYPYTSIVELQITYPDHKTFVGTGVMVDSFHVLTAGHVVYDYSEGGWASTIKVVPELNGTSQPFGVAYMSYERTYTAWTSYSKAHPHSTAAGDYDIALITLDRTLGNKTGWMSYGYNNNNAEFAAGRVFNTAGYPAAGGYDGKHMEFSSGQIAGLSSDKTAIQYYQTQITTFGGQSGSPVWEYFPATNTRVVYGIHVGGSGTSNSLNFATRITQSIYTDLQNWRAADKAPTTQLTITQTSAPGLNLTSMLRSGLQTAEWSDGVMAGADCTDGGAPNELPATVTVTVPESHAPEFTAVVIPGGLVNYSAEVNVTSYVNASNPVLVVGIANDAPESLPIGSVSGNVATLSALKLPSENSTDDTFGALDGASFDVSAA